jgi:thaumarchaeosortase
MTLVCVLKGRIIVCAAGIESKETFRTCCDGINNLLINPRGSPALDCTMMKLRGQFAKRLTQLSSRHLFLGLAAAPVLVLFALAPETFELFWSGAGKLGRGGLFLVLFFLGFDLLDLPKEKIEWTRKRKIVIALTVAVGVLYFIEIAPGQSLTNVIYSVGRTLGAHGDVSNPNSVSFLMATDYLALTVYLAALTPALFSKNMILRVVTPFALSLGMMVFYALDAFFPYDTLGPLQFWANFIVAAVAFLAKLFGLAIYGFANHLNIVGLHAFCPLVVFWPSVGVQSMLIYSVVMVVLAAKLQAPRNRKLVYAAIGIAGTVFLNVIRIFSIAYYGYAYAATCNQVNDFHNVIGEILFPIWIVVFLASIIKIEDRFASHSQTKELVS